MATNIISNNSFDSKSSLDWTEGYLKWIEVVDWDSKRLSLLSQKFIEFITLHRFYTYDNIENTSKEFSSVYGNCDNIPFNDYDQVTAYCIAHFLPRYRRFQLIFQELIRKKVFPMINSGYPLYILDIGTGPGPSLFALSDFFLSLKLYGKENDIPELTDLEFRLDYVEKSEGFREWLHHFTEFANANSNDLENDWIWRTPYHHGTFSDLKNIKFNEVYYFNDIDEEGDMLPTRGLIKYRPHFVIASNFFTTIEMAQEFKNELKECVKYMKNKGILIVTGGKGEKYIEINSIIENSIEHKNQKRNGYESTCSRNSYVDPIMEYNYSDSFAGIIKKAKQNIFSLFDKELLKRNVDKNTLININGSIGEKSLGKDSWRLQVFQKFSKPIWGKPK